MLKLVPNLSAFIFVLIIVVRYQIHKLLYCFAAEKGGPEADLQRGTFHRDTFSRTRQPFSLSREALGHY